MSADASGNLTGTAKVGHVVAIARIAELMVVSILANGFIIDGVAQAFTTASAAVNVPSDVVVRHPIGSSTYTQRYHWAKTGFRTATSVPLDIEDLLSKTVRVGGMSNCFMTSTPRLSIPIHWPIFA